MASRAYLLSLPERVIRSVLGLSAGLLREVGELVLPRGVRRTQRALPNRARLLSASARLGASHTGKLVSAATLDHYTRRLQELREVGYVTYAKRQLSPYVRACVDQFSPQRQTLTQRLLATMRKQ